MNKKEFINIGNLKQSCSQHKLFHQPSLRYLANIFNKYKSIDRMYMLNINQREKKEEEWIPIMRLFLFDIVAKTIAPR